MQSSVHVLHYSFWARAISVCPRGGCGGAGACFGAVRVSGSGADRGGYDILGEDLPGKPVLGQLCRRVLRLVPELERMRLLR